MKKYISLSLLLAVFVTYGCQNDETVIDNSTGKHIISAAISDFESRTSLNDRTILWQEDDLLSVFLGTTTNQKFAIHSGAGTNFAEFVSDGKIYITGGAESDENAFVNVAFYPYNNDISIVKNESTYKIETSLPKVQIYRENSFGQDAFPMAAVTSSNKEYAFAFKNVCGYLKMNLKGTATIVQAEVRSAYNKLSGPCDITVANGVVPQIQMADESFSSVILDCSEGVTLNETEYTSFIFVIPPTKFKENDLSFIFYDSDGNCQTWNIKSTNEVPRNDFRYWETTYSGNEAGTPSLITNEKLLKSALKSETPSEVPIVIHGDIELTDALTIEATSTIDLNGHNLNTGSNTINVAEGQALTLTNSSASTCSRSTVANASITGSSDIITAAKNSTITIGEGVSLINTANNCCVFVPKGAEGVTVNTNANLYTTGVEGETNYATIYVNGYVESGTINILGGSVKHGKDCAVYIGGSAELNISGGEIEGTTGVEIRAGKLNIQGTPVITATGDPFTSESNNNGSTSVGAAVAICQHETDYNLEATISGGTFNGVRALYEEDLQNETETDKIFISITNGTFNGEVYSENVKDFIVGGTFSDASAFNYLADGANVVLSESSTLAQGIIIDNNNVTLNLNGQTLSYTGNDVFFRVNDGGNLTINGKVSGSKIYTNPTEVSATGGNGYIALVKTGGVVTFDGGDYEAGNTCTIAQAAGGTVYVKDGNFSVNSSEYGNIYLLNHTDALKNDGLIEVTGGTFKGYDPANSVSENPAMNFVKVGYGSYEIETGVWTVVPATETIEVNNPEAFTSALSAGLNVKLTGDFTLEGPDTYDGGEKLIITKNTSIDLNGKTLTYTGANRIFYAQGEGVVVTINATGGGKIYVNPTAGVDAGTTAGYVATALDGAKIVINGGEYEVEGCTVFHATSGWFEINDGTFKANESYTTPGLYGYKYTLNCSDANYKSGNANFIVKGGKYYKFNPADNASEGENTNYVAEGYSTTIEDDYYLVAPATSVNSMSAESVSVVNW